MRSRWRAASIAAGVAAVALGAWSIGIEPGRLIVHCIGVRLPGIPSDPRPFKIVVLSDVHAGSPHVGREALRRIAATVNGLHPDVVVFLGDLVMRRTVGGRFMDPEPAAQELGAITPRLAKVAVLGNHDWWFDGPRVRRSLEAAGHTHGGQVRLPWIGAPIVPSAFGQRYAAGLIEEEGRRLFVTSGIGTSILPVRFRVPPEIAEVILTR